MSDRDQWLRKVELLISSNEKVLKLSYFRMKFEVQNADIESPNNCHIRVYNLSTETVTQIQKEFSEITLNAGYVDGNYGAIFKGTIKQFKIGRENATDKYLDIFAADGDTFYNQGIVATTLAAGATPKDTVTAVSTAMTGSPPDLTGLGIKVDAQHKPAIRGQVLFAMGRIPLRNYADTLDCSWSIQGGKVVMISNTGYLAGEAVEINVETGMIGIPEQTAEGIKVKCLLNPKIRIGGLVHLNNGEIAQTMFQDPNGPPVAYNQYHGVISNAAINCDGWYRVYAANTEGDTRGDSWYTLLTCLAVDYTAPKDESVDPK